MIKEDFVSFEIAELLKEKGFNAEIDTYYSPEGEFKIWCPNGLKSYLDNSGTETWWWKCIAPSQSMAMKWLREVCDVMIYVKLINDGDIYHDAWGFIIYNKFTNKYVKSDKLCFKYEQACEAAIKYCLELI